MSATTIVTNVAFSGAIGQIRTEVDKRITSARADLAKIDAETQKVLPVHLPYPVVKFSKIEQAKTLQSLAPKTTEASSPDQVIYVVSAKTFIAKKGNEYYSNWDTRDMYIPQALGEPHKDRLFICQDYDALLMYGEDNTLYPVVDFSGFAKSADVYTTGQSDQRYMKLADISYMTSADAKTMVTNCFASNS